MVLFTHTDYLLSMKVCTCLYLKTEAFYDILFPFECFITILCVAWSLPHVTFACCNSIL